MTSALTIGLLLLFIVGLVYVLIIAESAHRNDKTRKDK